MTLSKNFSLLALCFIIFSTQQSIAQKELIFQIKFKPNKTYINDMTNNMQMQIDFAVDSEQKKRMEATGMKLPMQMNMLQEMTLSTKTGSLSSDKRIPMTMTYDKVGITTSVNGQEIKQPDKLTGMKIKAFATEEGKISLDSIESASDAATRESLQKMIAQIFKSVEFPNKAMKIGDSFTQEVPMEIPVRGTTLNMLSKVTYTLKEIKGNEAFFDYIQGISMNFKIEKSSSSASGSGKGTMVYNIPANYITDTTGDMTMDMKMQMGEAGMKMDLKAQTSVKVKVL